MSRTTLVVACAAALSCAALAPAVGLNTPHHATSVSAGGNAHAGHTADHTTSGAMAVVRGVDGKRHGTVRLRQTSDGVHVTARLHGLPSDSEFHGFHVHSEGSCVPGDPEDPFQSAGGHYPGDEPVDPENPVDHAQHAGDMPSLLAVGDDGQAHASFVTDRFTVEELMDADGSAVMVHADPDNFANIPPRYISTDSEDGTGGPDDETFKGGDSGDRIACGVVEASTGPATAVVMGADGERHGTVWLRQTRDGVQVTARLHGLDAGFHGFHVHTEGSCVPGDPEDPFQSAGGHYPGDEPVDPENPVDHAQHAGDMPPLLASAAGHSSASFVTDRFSLDELMEGNGSAVMVHADPDNFANIPADRYRSRTRAGVPDKETRTGGDSGDRMACGVVSHGGAR